jgi:hypothetical protein
MYGYKAFYNGKTADINANSLYAAKQAAIVGFKVPRMASRWKFRLHHFNGRHECSLLL